MRNNIKSLLDSALSLREFSKGYFNYLKKLLDEIDLNSIVAFAKELEESRQSGNTIFFVGNGGSAATASHMVNDFGTDVKKITNTDKPFRVLSLSDNPAVMLAVANDSGYDKLFVNQIQIHYRPGDKLVAISASGNSPNIVAAAEWFKAKGGSVLSLVGFDGGKLKAMSDVAIHVKSGNGEFGPVEDIHLIMGHLISCWLQSEIQKQQKANRG